MKNRAILAVIAIAAAGGARAQNAAAPTAEALALARTLVQKSGAGGENALTGLSLPLPDYLRQLGVAAPDQVRALSHEVVMPALAEHADDLAEIQVKSYATLLSPVEMKAAIAFYDSPAAQHLLKLTSGRAEANISQAGALIVQLRPEIQLRAQDVAHAHGWPPPPG